MTSSFVMAATLLLPASRAAATDIDARWTAWLGCWQQVEETVRNENVAEPRDTAATEGVVVCVTPAAEPAAVRLSTMVEKQMAFEETIIADGSSRAIDESGCTGSQRVRWSRNGQRLFATADLSCGDGTKRTITGLATIAPGPVWVDVQVVNRDGHESIRVRRYRRATDQSHVSSRVGAEQLSSAAAAAARQARSLSLDEIKEAAGSVTPSTLEAALIETDARYPLNASRLRELDAAGVPDRVLDLMIAMSFPDKFVVERRSSTSSSSYGVGMTGGGLGWFDAGYDIFPYYYAPFAYGMWGRPDYYYYGAPMYAVEVAPNNEPQPSGQGRVVDGMGYTRVRARDPQPVNADGVPLDGFGGSSSSGGSTSSGGVSSQGYSGGGGGDSGRTAVSRPPQ